MFNSLKITVLVTTFIFSQTVVAQSTTSSRRAPTVAQPAAAPVAAATPPSSAPIAPNYNAGGGSGGNINKGAGQAAGKEMMGAIMSMAAGAAFFAASFQDGKPCGNVMMCVMSAAQIAQAGMNMAANSGSNQAKDASSFDTGVGYGGSESYGAQSAEAQPGPNLGHNGALTLKKKIDDLKGKLAQAGVSMSDDGKKVTIPGKGSMSTIDLAGQGGMKSLGMNDQQIAATTAAIQKIEKDVTAKMNLGSSEFEGASGKGSVGANASGAGSYSSGYNFGGAGGGHKQRVAASIAGLSVKRDGDNIGISADNIFQMMSRRYNELDQKDSFYKQ